jgi:hypothetical protein
VSSVQLEDAAAVGCGDTLVEKEARILSALLVFP